MQDIVIPDVSKLPLKNKTINKIIVASAKKTGKVQTTKKEYVFPELLKKYKLLTADQKNRFHEFVESLPDLNKMNDFIDNNSEVAVKNVDIYVITELWEEFFKYDFGNSFSSIGKSRAKKIVEGENLMNQMKKLTDGYTTKKTLLGLVSIYLLLNKEQTYIDGRNIKSDQFLLSALDPLFVLLQEDDSEQNKNKKGPKKREFDPNNFNKMRLNDLVSKGLEPVNEPLCDADITAIMEDEAIVEETLSVLESISKKK